MVPDLPAVETAIVEMTNAFRRKAGKRELQRNANLDAAARAFAAYLARTGRFSHTADGRQPAQRVETAGYAFCQVAENLALHRDDRGFRSRQLARLALEGWKNSPGHRRNLEAEHVTEIGVGVAKAETTLTFISVQLFGRPKALRYAFKVRNTTPVSVSYKWEDEAHTLRGRTEVTHTVCRPGALVLNLPRANGGQGDLRAQTFRTTPDALFIVRRTQRGGLTASEKPAL